jgi:hypothetical protein
MKEIKKELEEALGDQHPVAQSPASPMSKKGIFISSRN